MKVLTEQQLGSIYLASERAQFMYLSLEEHKWYSSRDGKFIFEPAGISLYLFLSLLYGVLEFLTDKNCIPKDIRSDIANIYDDLREFRNCVFHPQDTVVSDRQKAFIKHPDSIRIVVNIHKTIYSLLSSELSRRSENRFVSP